MLKILKLATLGFVRSYKDDEDNYSFKPKENEELTDDATEIDEKDFEYDNDEDLTDTDDDIYKTDKETRCSSGFLQLI